MATMTRIFGLRHLRAEPSFHVLQYRRGELKRSGKGLAFWFVPLSTSIAEVPCSDRDENFLFHGRSHDYQNVTVQGVITYRVTDPRLLAERVDFSIELDRGYYRKEPLEHISQLLIQAAQQHAWSYLTATAVREILADGVDEVRARIRNGLRADESLAAMGLEIVAVRVSDVAPTAELDKALQAPTNEAIQQEADEAVFQRRALAVEKERAIQENELQNKIELARREAQLITQAGENERQRATEEAESLRISAEAEAERDTLDGTVRAGVIRDVGDAKAGAEKARMEIYRDMPSHVLMGLAAKEAASVLGKIEHLNITPELLGPALAKLANSLAE